MQLGRNWNGVARSGILIAVVMLAPAMSQATVLYDGRDPRSVSSGATPSCGASQKASHVEST